MKNEQFGVEIRCIKERTVRVRRKVSYRIDRGISDSSSRWEVHVLGFNDWIILHFEVGNGELTEDRFEHFFSEATKVLGTPQSN